MFPLEAPDILDMVKSHRAELFYKSWTAAHTLTDEKSVQSEHLKELQSKRNELSAELRNTQRDKDQVSAELKKVKRRLAAVEKENSNLHDAFERLEGELDELRGKLLVFLFDCCW